MICGIRWKRISLARCGSPKRRYRPCVPGDPGTSFRYQRPDRLPIPIRLPRIQMGTRDDHRVPRGGGSAAGHQRDARRAERVRHRSGGSIGAPIDTDAPNTTGCARSTNSAEAVSRRAIPSLRPGRFWKSWMPKALRSCSSRRRRGAQSRCPLSPAARGVARNRARHAALGRLARRCSRTLHHGDGRCHRTVAKKARTSSTNSSGCSNAAKCPPRGMVVQWVMR